MTNCFELLFRKGWDFSERKNLEFGRALTPLNSAMGARAVAGRGKLCGSVWEIQESRGRKPQAPWRFPIRCFNRQAAKPIRPELRRMMEPGSGLAMVTAARVSPWTENS